MARFTEAFAVLIISASVIGIDLPTPRIVIMGQTGAGKSTLANVLLGYSPYCQNCTFPVCPPDHLDSCTKETRYAVGDWLGKQAEFTIVDTPGFGDSNNDDNSLIDEMMTTLKETVKEANALVLLINGGETRFNNALQQMVREMEALFGERFWANAIIGVSFWPYDAVSVKRRQRNGITEEQFIEGWNEQLEQKFHINRTLDGVFIDAMSQDYLDDEAQQVAFQRETAKLWNFAQNTKLFAFKTVEDVLEENQKLKAEVDWLNDVITRNITKLQADLDLLRQDDEKNHDQLEAEVTILRHNNKVDQQENLKRFDNLSHTTSENKNLINSLQTTTNANTNLINDMKTAPLGTIIAWVNRPETNTPHVENLEPANGWVRCDGSVIPSPSPWVGQRTPNINGENRFLRGGVDSIMLQKQDDSLQSHTHAVNDPGHTHGYNDKYPNWGGHYDGNLGPVQTDRKTDRWDKDHPSTSNSAKTKINVIGVQGARTDSETRPKNMRVVYIMRVF